MGERKILLFDLDGTLLRDDKTLSERTLRALNECRSRGHYIGIATSRSEINCEGILREIRPDIVISSGGAMARVKGEIARTVSFSARETKEFIARAREICGDCEITADTLHAHYWNYKADPREQDKSWSGSVYTDFEDFEREALKICVLIPSAERAGELCREFPLLDCRRFSDGDWYKFTKGGVTKENAIEYVCEKLNLSLSDAVAFGDDYSDTGMLKICGVGVAMGNGIEDVKKIADDITLSNEEDGTAVYLEKCFMQGSFVCEGQGKRLKPTGCFSEIL